MQEKQPVPKVEKMKKQLIQIFTLLLLLPFTGNGAIPEKLVFEIVASFPHSPNAFTQGLFFHKGHLYESTGQYGKSTMRKVDISSGRVIKQVSLPSITFGEGTTICKGKIFQLTWHSKIALIYTPGELSPAGSIRYPGNFEGWGITCYKNSLFISDGTDTLRIINPEDFSLKGTVKVTLKGTPMYSINELETAGNHIYANIWQKNIVVRISPETGNVTAIVDLTDLVPFRYKRHPEYVLNGIAWNSQKNTFYITGKNWNILYELKLKKTNAHPQ